MSRSFGRLSEEVLRVMLISEDLLAQRVPQSEKRFGRLLYCFDGIHRCLR